MAIITNPQLPPKAGYVEDEDETGARFYRKVNTEQDEHIADLIEKNTILTAKLNAAIQSNSFLEDCIVEMAGVVYA